MTLAETIAIAKAADDNFSRVVKAHGYKSRWDMGSIPQQSQALRDAYFAKVDADEAMHNAFEQSRKAARADLYTDAEYAKHNAAYCGG